MPVLPSPGDHVTLQTPVACNLPLVVSDLLLHPPPMQTMTQGWSSLASTPPLASASQRMSLNGQSADSRFVIFEYRTGDIRRLVGIQRPELTKLLRGGRAAAVGRKGKVRLSLRQGNLTQWHCGWHPLPSPSQARRKTGVEQGLPSPSPTCPLPSCAGQGHRRVGTTTSSPYQLGLLSPFPLHSW